MVETFRCEGNPAIKALSLAEVEWIAEWFRKLNPYDSSLVPEILKIEDVNHVDCDPKKPFRRLSVTRFQRNGTPFIHKRKMKFAAWDHLLRKELGLTLKEPPWLRLPAMMRMVLT
jgi:hypothetical protein